jgi:hypothetical protein
MSKKSETTVIGSLPHSRPQRRSDKRAARPTQAQADTAPAAPQPRARPAQRSAPKPAPRTQAAAATDDTRPSCPSSLPDGAELIGTVVKATFELAEIGMTVGARALRTAVSRLPRP